LGRRQFFYRISRTSPSFFFPSPLPPPLLLYAVALCQERGRGIRLKLTAEESQCRFPSGALSFFFPPPSPPFPFPPRQLHGRRQAKKQRIRPFYYINRRGLLLPFSCFKPSPRKNEREAVGFSNRRFGSPPPSSLRFPKRIAGSESEDIDMFIEDLCVDSLFLPPSLSFSPPPPPFFLSSVCEKMDR